MMEVGYEVVPFDPYNQAPVKQNRRTTVNKTCYKCNKVFPYAYNCRRHMKTCRYPDVKGTFKCSECLEVFYCSDMYFAHLPIKHADIVIKKQKFEFLTHEEFHLWKLKMENETMSFFKKDYHYKRTLTKVKVVERYHCHRSGIYVSRGTGKRNSKGKGTNKCGFYCPAMFTRSVEDSGLSFVLFQSTHLGHTCEVKQLTSYKAVRKTKKSTVCKKLSSLSYQDLQGTVASYVNLISTRLPNLKSLSIWAKQMMSCGSNPILLFKGYDEENVSHSFLKKTDFVLGFMNDIQEEVLTTYGCDVVSINTTGGDGKHCIQLTSVLVKGLDGEGLPVAFLWSNNLSEEVLEAFFKAILERGCVLDCSTFMSDCNTAYYNTWCNVYRPAKFNLFCDSDVQKTWAENVSIGPNSIKSLEKRNEVLSVLYSMQKETDLKTFKCSLTINSSFWLEDPMTERFGVYFASNFVNTAHMWAACYRDSSTVGMDDVLEKWHEHLYNIDLKVESEDSMDQTVYYIMKSKRKVLLNHLAFLTDSKHEAILNEIRKCHKLAVGMFEDKSSVHELSENVWIVPSFTQKGVVYKVKYLNSDVHDCDLKCYDCGSCLHQYICSCTDSAIKFELCKHIHLICLHLTSNSHSKRSEEMPNNNTLNLRFKAECAFFKLWSCVKSLKSETALKEVIHTLGTIEKKLKGNPGID